MCLIGRKSETYFKRYKANIIGVATHLGETPAVQDLIGVIKVMLDRYDEGELDAVYIACNEFINTMVQKPMINQLLPLESSEAGTQAQKGHWDYIYEPDSSKQLLTSLLVRYIESQVYQGVIENISCEQSARMVAMKSATDNAGDIMDELQLVYNKARQAGITQEIAEIVGGAAAIE